jgi:hypothetical protein
LGGGAVRNWIIAGSAFGVGALVVWAACGAPMPSFFERQMSHERVQQATADRAALVPAQREGRLAEDPTQHALRTAVLDAGKALEAATCDPERQAALREAVNRMTRFERENARRDPPLEVLVVDGRTIDARSFLNRAADAVRADAGRAGIMNPKAQAARGEPVGPLACNKSS